MPKLRLIQDEKLQCTQCNEFKDFSCFGKSNQPKNTYKLTYLCKECAKNKVHEYRNTEAGFWVGVWNNLTQSAKTRKIDVEVTKEDIVNLWNKQQGLCAITKLPMQKVKAQRTTRSRCMNQFRASVDRIDSEKGYVKGNIRMVCAYVNVMKLDQTDEQLKFWCNAILKGMNNG
jgi:hypothetical protein